MTAALVAAAAAWALSSDREASRPDAPAPAARVAVRRPIAIRPVGGVRAAPVIDAARAAAIADELVIAPRAGASADDAAAAIADAGGEVAWRAPRTGLLLARFAGADDARAARAALAADPRVGGVFANHVMTGAGIATSPSKLQQWMLTAMQLTPSAHPARGITVAVLDTGVAYETYRDASGVYAQAPDLAATPIAAGYDFVNDDAHPDDDHGHGTHIANIIAASATIAPMAPGATVMPVKVLDATDRGTELALAEGIRYAVDHGAHVINMSLAFPPGYFPSRYLQDAIDYADANQVVMVAAAGNQGGDVITYPAAFRDVIAVGASKLSSLYRSPRWLPWFMDDLFLVRAEYSNRGFRVDVASPAGAMTGDADGDGLPEAVVAQTFAPGQPTQFQYRLWAGTSQAAAQVSGVAAGMLAANRALTPRQIRALLGESARPELGVLTLSPFVGRGYLRADAAAYLASRESSDARPHYEVALRLGIATSPSNALTGRATVEVLDDAGRPAPGVYVYGTFSGGVDASGMQRTDDRGQAVFVSPALTDAHVVAFEVDAVADRWVAPRVFDRPRGAIRIDSCSLELLSAWAAAQGIATSPSASSQGIATSPGQTVGAGIATSPSGGSSGQGIATSPSVTSQGIATSPIALHSPLQAGEVDFYNLLNYSWAGATMPMAVAVDATWFKGAFPDAPIIQSTGAGIATSPIALDAATSFAAPVAPPTNPNACTPMVVRTFVPAEIADGIPPVAPDPAQCGSDAACAAQRAALADVWAWAATGQGIATSPSWTAQTQLTQPAFTEAVVAIGGWAQFAMAAPASPVSDYGSVLEAAGIATSPSVEAADDPSAGSSPLP